jgi:transcriptional regulator with XRE-family HTH domain
MNDNLILKRIRIQLGYTQKSFGKRLRVTQGAVSHWERGVTYPSVPIATKIAKMAEKKGILFTIKQLRGENG